MRHFVLLGLILSAVAPAAAQSPLARGSVLYSADFEGPKAEGWSGSFQLVHGYEGGQSMLIEQKGSPQGSAMASYTLPVEKMRGYLIRCTAMVKAEGVSAKPKPWNGVKFMAPIEGPDGKQWPAANTEVGSYDWRPVAFQFRVPANATRLTLALGLEQVSGRVWYDSVRITVWKTPRTPPVARGAGEAFKGHDLPRLRGAMVSPRATEEDLRTLGQVWKANVIRWQLIRSDRKADPLDLVAYDAWLASAQRRLDEILPWCEKYGLKVVVDLHSPPGGHAVNGGYSGSDNGLFTSEACQKRFVELWRDMAVKYKDSKAIWGYDLANEPVESPGGADLADWQQLAERAARAVRQVDARRAIIVEPAEWGGPSGLAELDPLPVPGIVYSVHMYLPHQFTHQGVHGDSPPIRYPGIIDGKHWDKAALERALQPAIDFQRNYNVHMYLGEFSAIRWAPGDSAYQYLRDCIEIFEKYGWDWSYHAFREWSGWSVEHSSDRANNLPTATPNERQTLLRGWYEKNERPR